jgi:hypothetical protein
MYFCLYFLLESAKNSRCSPTFTMSYMVLNSRITHLETPEELGNCNLQEDGGNTFERGRL